MSSERPKHSLWLLPLLLSSADSSPCLLLQWSILAAAASSLLPGLIHFHTPAILMDHDSSSSESDTYGPKIPSSARTIGPALPLDLKRDESSSDEDDSYGPLLPGQETNRDYSSTKIIKSSDDPSKQSKREEWMTVVPDKLEARLGFTAKSVTSFSKRSNEPAGKSKDEPKAPLPNEPPPFDDERSKGPSLLELHQQQRLEKKRKSREDARGQDEKRRPLEFDPEKDFQSRRMNSRQTNSVISKAKLLNTRFTSSSRK